MMAKGQFEWTTGDNMYYASNLMYFYTSNGHLLVGGKFNEESIVIGLNTLTKTGGSNGTSDMYIADFDQNGNIVWSTSLGSDEEENINGVGSDNSGSIYFGGTYSGATFTIGEHTINNAGKLTSNVVAGKYVNTNSIYHNSLSPEIQLFPNPSSDYIVLNSASENKGKFSYSIFSCSGKLIRQKGGLNTMPAIIDVHDLSEGIYYISIQSDEFRKSVAFSIIH
ncbi:MAG: T9SS type A sorting domain-containing protein [Bacteroidia bacterium]